MPPLENPQIDTAIPEGKKPRTGILTLGLLGITAFTFTYAYMDTITLVPASQTAAATQIDAYTSVSIEAKGAIVVDLMTGKTLYTKNADAQLPLASLTKVAMALAVSDVLPLDTIITIPYDTAPKGSAMRLAKGEQWRIGDIINFTLVASSNEGANILAAAADSAVLAKYPDASPEAPTLWLMNSIARKLGLSNTYFLNVNGLDLSTTQAGAYGSARGMELLFAYAASTSPGIFTGTTKDGLLLTDESGNTTSAINTNEALGQIPGLIMGKTGFTDLAGGNLGLVFDVGLAHPVVAIVLGSSREGRFVDMHTLLVATRDFIMNQ